LGEDPESDDDTRTARRITLIDDDAVYLAVLAKGLRKRGFAVRTYADPREAMEALVEDRPLAVITDMRMPHMSGLEVVQDVRDRLGAAASPPILVVSADDDERLLEEAFRLGATDYLLKPINEVELGVKVERALRDAKPSAPNESAAVLPERIGSWNLIDCIGRGGTACVFTAVRDGGESVHALKVVWPHLTASTETMLRFRREIDTLSTLEHPRLIRLVESGRHEDFFYYVMTFVPGGSLRRRIRRQGPRGADEALRVIDQIAEPLGYLHERGLVHRDVKPGNVFFDKHDGAVLGDFGLARRLRDRGITLNEEFIGTPLYLAPEVFHSPEFDQSVDFYALGVCAFEMLLGRPVLDEGDTLRLIARIMDEGLPRPAELLDDVPRPLVELLEQLMAPAGRRPTTAEAVQAAVARVRAELG